MSGRADWFASHATVECPQSRPGCSHVTVPPGFLAANNYVVPRNKRVSDFLRIHVDEAYQASKQDWEGQCNNIATEFGWLNDVTGEVYAVADFPPKPTEAEFIQKMNFCRNFLWHLWISWPGSEERDVWNDIIKWCVENLRPIVGNRAFERCWRNKTRANIQLRWQAPHVVPPQPAELAPQAEAEEAPQAEPVEVELPPAAPEDP